MDRDNRYFFTAGFLSFFLFFLFIFLFVIFFARSELKIEVPESIVVSLDVQEPQQEEAMAEPEVVEAREEAPTIKEIVASTTPEVSKPTKEKSVDSLFGEVKAQKQEQVKALEAPKEIDKKIFDELGKKVDKSSQAEAESVVKKIENISKQVDVKNSSTKKDSDEYLSKIHATVYNNFRPPKNSAKSIAVAIIEISAMGRLIDFRIVSYSNNSALNSEADRIKSRLQNQLFPKNPDNSNVKYTINLIPEE